MTRAKDTYSHHYHRHQTLQNRLRRQAEEEEHGQISKMIYSNFIQHLHSRQFNEEPSYTHCQDLSQDKYRAKSIMRKEPKKYVPLSKKVIQVVKDESVSKLQKKKQFQYTQSEQYKRYHEQIFKNSKNSKEIMDRMRTLRSNNVYIAKEEANQKVTKRIEDHIKSYAESNYDTRCLSNLSKITEKQMILIHDPDFEEVELTCQPYLQCSSIFSNAYKQEMKQKKLQLAPYHFLNQANKRSQVSATKMEKWKKKDSMRQSKQNLQKIAYSPSSKEPLKQSLSIYNIDFKLDRPSNVNPTFTRCISNINLSKDKSISSQKSRNKAKMLVVTASGRKPC